MDIETIKISQLPSDTTVDQLPGVNDGTTVKTTPGSLATEWRDLATSPTNIVYDGQRQYTITFPGVDYSGLINPGTRLRTSRTVAAPTRSSSLNGTTQYWTKTSPNKMTWTDDFVVSCWIKLNAVGGTVVSRYNGTSGWRFFMEADGRIALAGYNAGAGNASVVRTTESLPVGRWIHVAAQLDMSAFTATTTTSFIMIDGVDVPVLVSRAGTNPTALVQAGNLEIGSENGGTNKLNGAIAQVAAFNAKVSQTTIQGYISQGLAGTETSLASAYSFSNSANDLNTTTPNDLTPSGSAGTSNAASPFGTQSNDSISSMLDYAIVVKSTYSTDTVLIVQTPHGCTIPTSGGVSGASISSAYSPYGLPSSRERWSIKKIFRVVNPQTVNNTTASISGIKPLVPVGSWDISYRAFILTTGGTSYLTATIGLSSSTTSFTNDGIANTISSSSSHTEQDSYVKAEAEIVVDTPTSYYLVASTAGNYVIYPTGNGLVVPAVFTLKNLYI